MPVLFSSARVLPTLSLTTAVLVLQACGGGSGGGGGDSLASCRAEAASAGLDFAFFQQIGGCLGGDESDDDFGEFLDDGAPDFGQSPDSDAPPPDESGPAVLPPIASFPAAVAPSAAPRDLPGAAFYTGAPNSVLITDIAIGGAATANASFARSVPFLVGETEDGLVVRDVRVLQDQEDGRGVDVVVTVENTGSALACGLFGFGIEILDDAGEPEGTNIGLGSVAGSNAYSMFGSDVANCIAGGTTAYLLNSGFGVETDIAAVYIDRVAPLLPFDTTPDGDGGPTVISSEVLEFGVDGDLLEMVIANQSAVAVELDDIQVLLLDDNGQVVFVDDTDTDETDLAPGAETTASVRFDDFDGSATSARVVVGYEREDR